MPVVMEELREEELYLITGRHRFQKDGKLLWLSDQIDLDFSFLDRHSSDDNLGPVIKLVVIRFDLPIDNVYVTASIGDVMQWVGLLIFLSFIPLLVIFTLILVGKNIFARKKWKE